MPNNHAVGRALLMYMVFLFSVAWRCQAQDVSSEPIRVESNEVVIPVVIVDKRRQEQLQQAAPKIMKRAEKKKDPNLLEESVAAIAIPDLTAKEIHVFEDGVEQNVVGVTFEREPYWNVKDYPGYHSEFIGRGGGKWSGPQWPEGMIAQIAVPHYLVAYVPPPSPEGSCHQVSVIVDPLNAVVNARSAYCNVKHPPSDPLFGTALEEQMELQLGPVAMDNVGLALFAAQFYSERGHSRVYIAVDISWFLPNTNAKGLLGMIYNKGGNLAARFSDLYDLEDAPQRFETQVELAPGEYTAKVVVSDGKKFGIVKSEFVVDDDAKELGLSTIALCRRIRPVQTRASGGDFLPLASKGVEYEPTGNARFKNQENIGVYFEVYAPYSKDRPTAAVSVEVRIVDAGGNQVVANCPPLSATQYHGNDSLVLRFGSIVNTRTLLIGAYDLEIQATDPEGKSTAWGKASFTIGK